MTDSVLGLPGSSRTTMSAAFSHACGEQRSSRFSHDGGQTFTVSPSCGGAEDRGVTQLQCSASVPFILYPSRMDPSGFGLYNSSLRVPGPGLLPYLAPFHHSGHFGIYDCPFEPAFIQKRNERERQRVKCVNQGYAKLRDHLPGHSADKRLSKVETLRAAIRYIKYLQDLVALEEHSITESPHTSSPSLDGGGESEDFSR